MYTVYYKEWVTANYPSNDHIKGVLLKLLLSGYTKPDEDHYIPTE